MNLVSPCVRRIFLFSHPLISSFKKNGQNLGRRWCALLLFFVGILTNPFLPSVFSAPQQQVDQSRLLTLKIAALKRELRLPDLPQKPTTLHLTLLKQYEADNFQSLVVTADRGDLGEKDAYTALIQGNSLVILGEREEAVAAFQRAFQDSVVPLEKSAAMANFGLVLSMSERWREAVHWLEKALEVDRAADNWPGQGMALSQLGAFYFKLGDTEKGAAAHIEALEISETIPIPWLQARQLSQLASLYHRDQSNALAWDYYEKAIELYRNLDDSLSEAGALTALSFVYKDLGQVEKALTLQGEALGLYQQLNDSMNASKVLLNLSLIYRDQGRFQDALDSAAAALEIQKQESDPGRLAEIEGTLGTIHEKNGHFSEALQHLKKARDYFEQAGASQTLHIIDLRIQALQDQME